MLPLVRRRVARVGWLALVSVALVSSPVRSDVWVLCEVASGDVVFAEKVDEGVHEVMGGPFPGERTATVWTAENCPGRRCDGEGRCVEGSPAADAVSTGGGWVAGELESKTLAGRPARPPAPARSTDADLSPLVRNAKAAAAGCNFAAALASVDHLANFVQDHPFYVANRDRLVSLAKRQRRTEQIVWQASTELSQGDLKGARELAQSAADTAVSCQNKAVAVLLDGIDTAIKQRREARRLANQRAAASLLPGLVSLSRALSGGQSPPAPDPEALAASAAEVFDLELSANAADPCAFNYEYRNKWDTAPVCICPGYAFNADRFRCEP